MKIEDLIQLLNNRLREFQLSSDYARMNGDLERMNVADKEILVLEDSLFKLNLLIDTSKSAAVKEEILAEVISDGSVSVLDEYDITSYATDPKHEQKIMNILNKMGVMDNVEKIDKYIKSKSLGSPVAGEMIVSASFAYSVDTRLMMAIMEQDSHFGTFGVAVRTLNPGNVGNDDDGNTRTYDSWQEGVTAVAEWLSRHRGSTIMPEISEETVTEPVDSSVGDSSSTTTGQDSTMPIIISEPTATATSTPTIVTSTTTTISNLPMTASTTTATTSPQVSTSTQTTATSTSATSDTTPTIQSSDEPMMDEAEPEPESIQEEQQTTATP